ncbi:CPBP family intramembrane glutamic endopeptidase [Sulfitobacter porphyrae]|uniref:CPBP family intramembrane glutamic endopeptidase n=1 Tax=Sulfitobacter porphyrae TaxID=1246864 RepID=A0ABW2B6V9_9RHOB
MLNFILTVVVGLVVSGLFHSVANPAGDMVASASQVDRILFFGWTAVQILGEEVFTILIFLGSMALLVRVMSRKLALCVAALVASVIFGLVHLPTYQWNMPQAFGLMPIRIVLLLPYIITRNIWTSTGVHILNDWAIFGSSALSAMDAG